MSLTTLPPELRHKILASVIWTPTATLYNHLDLFYQDPPRVRLRDDWDIWIPATSPQPPALPLLSTCRILHDDVQYLLHSPTAAPKSHAREIDIVFIPKCGLFPTWGRQGQFLHRYHGISSDFNADDKYYPNPPPGSWNFYRLLVSFLALGPQGLCSPAYQREHRGNLLSSSRSRSPPRYSVRHLVISVTSKEETEIDEERWERADRGAQRFLIAHNEDLPYGAEGEEEIFPGPPPPNDDDDDDFAQYTWTGPTDLRAVRGMHIHAGRNTFGHADRYGLYLANTLWALLDFGGWLSRGFGLMLYESIHDDITFCVDGEPRPRFGVENLLLSFLERPEPLEPSRTLTPEVAAALKVWKEWLVK
ncbi:hypothetical protein B0T13DRAFT_501024 [Neurospora crassa]|nr:hypothetical protein B0T13DRAFT_501024 [Neurospora crassa]